MAGVAEGPRPVIVLPGPERFHASLHRFPDVLIVGRRCDGRPKRGPGQYPSADSNSYAHEHLTAKNSKHEIRNPNQIQKPECSKLNPLGSAFEISCFELAADFRSLQDFGSLKISD